MNLGAHWQGRSPGDGPAGKRGCDGTVLGGLAACDEREQLTDAAEDSLAKVEEAKGVMASEEGVVQLTAEVWADPNIVLPSLTLNGSSGAGLESRRLTLWPGSKNSSETAGIALFLIRG